jgi:hypothetical protein
MAGRTLRRVAVIAVVVLVLLAAVDRIGVYLAERTAGDTIQSSQHLSSRPGVDIAGFPFLTQLATGKYDKITVTANDVPVGRRLHLLVISRIEVVLHTLTVSRDFSSVRARDATATAQITFADLGKTLGVDLAYAGNGRIRATRTVTVAGASVQAAVTTRPQLVNGGLSFVGTSVDNAGALDGAVTAALGQVFDLAIPLQGIPFDIRVRELRVGADGVTIKLTGRDLAYSN